MKLRCRFFGHARECKWSSVWEHEGRRCVNIGRCWRCGAQAIEEGK